MAKQYSQVTLKEIGEQCGHNLPPASAVQAMFLYEMQRESELERLFQGHLFKLARLDDNSKTLQNRVSELSGDVKKLRNNVDAQVLALRKEITTKEVEERLSTSQVRMDTFQGKLNQCNGRIDDQEAQSKTTRDRIKEVSESMTAEQAEVKAKIASLDEDIALLFEERDALFETASTGTERIEGLEKAVTEIFRSNKTSNDALVTTEKMLETYGNVLSLKNEQNKRIDRLEQEQNERMEKLQSGLIEAFKTLVKDQRERIRKRENEQNDRIQKLESERNELIEHINRLKIEQNEHIMHTNRLNIEQNDRIDALKNEQNDRIDKLEDLVRVLTAQSPTTSSPASQILAVHSTNGQSLDLVVQKGNSFIPYKKENIRSFTPGKPWIA